MTQVNALPTQATTQSLQKQENFILKDDLKGLSGPEKTKFYLDLCSHLGLSPITKPFGIYDFQGKEVLYIKADAFDQLCAKQKVSRRIVQQQVATANGIINQDFVTMGDGNDQTYLVKVEASITVDGEKVFAEDIAEVPVKEEKFEWTGWGNDRKKVSKGMHRNTNALMKAITKAYRRAAKKLISVGSVLLEDDLETSTNARDLNLSTGDVVGGPSEKNPLDVALPAKWKGFSTLKEIDEKDSELLSVLFKELTEAKATKGLSEQWNTVLQVIEKNVI